MEDGGATLNLFNGIGVAGVIIVVILDVLFIDTVVECFIGKGEASATDDIAVASHFCIRASSNVNRGVSLELACSLQRDIMGAGDGAGVGQGIGEVGTLLNLWV